MKIYKIAKELNMKIYKIAQNYDIVLPGQDFFNPNPDFLIFLKQLVGGKLVIECGAGNGLLTKKMEEVGINVLPIDLFKRDSGFISIKEDATKFKYPKNGIALIARPSRGDWIHDTILQALNTVNFVLYIGIDSHLEDDVQSLDSLYPNIMNVEKIYDNAGKDEEKVFKISKKQEVTAGDKYYLVKYQSARNIYDISWFEDGGNKWINFNGGWSPKSNTNVILEEQIASDMRELDWKKTSLYKPNSDSGWLDRNGKFTGCDSRMHDLIADLILNQSVAELENQGWVRIYGKDSWVLPSGRLNIRLSPAQRNYLSSHGHHISDDD
jgi:hypothetical protein